VVPTAQGTRCEPAPGFVVEAESSTQQFAFVTEAREARFAVGGPGEGSAWSPSFFRLGMQHILGGYDHLLFLLALLLRGGRLLSLLAIVTAFTLAHSLMLALAVLDVVALPPTDSWRAPSRFPSLWWPSRTCARGPWIPGAGS
jgi:hypothetical protein